MQGVEENITRRWIPEDKTRIVMKLLVKKITIAELCRRYNLNSDVFYNWKEKFIGDMVTLSGYNKNCAVA
jgi:transposase-like protein